MKASNFLSERSMTKLSELDLTGNAQEIQSLLENLSSDLPHYLLRIEATLDSNASAIAALGVAVAAAGARFKSRGSNLLYRKSYKELVAANSFDLARELACSAYHIPSSCICPGKNRTQSQGIRMLLHKAWRHSKWEGKYKSKSLDKVIAKLPRKPKKALSVCVGGDYGTFDQKGSSFVMNPKGVPVRRLGMRVYTVYEELHIRAAGLGSLTVNESKVPVFNLDAPCKMYLVGEAAKGGKHIIGFPDVSALTDAGPQVERWVLNRLCHHSSRLTYALEGRDANDMIVRICFGIPPFYMPEVTRF